MNTRACRIFFLATIAAILILSVPAAGHAAEYVSVKKDAVNIRTGPSTKDKVIWQVFEGFPLQIEKRQGKWVNTIDYEGDEGWIYDTLISDKKTVIVTVETANMRSGPSTDDNVIATVKKGVVFDFLEMDGDWMKVSYKDELTGWMHNSLVWPSNPR